MLHVSTVILFSVQKFLRIEGNGKSEQQPVIPWDETSKLSPL